MIPLLTSSIPDLKLDSGIINCQRLREKRRSDRRFLPPNHQFNNHNRSHNNQSETLTSQRQN
ncbi:hypothetical protein Hanom_Chr06g00500091 [Helianthus anomalus]